MANPSLLSGLSPVGYINGSPWNGQARTYWIPSTDTNVYAPGDPVATTPGADANGIAQVTIGLAGSPIRGVMVGITTRGTVTAPMTGQQNRDRTYVPATKERDYYIEVVDDPQVIFEIQEGGSGSALTTVSVSLNANFVSGTFNGWVSQYVLDNATTGTSADLNLKLLGLAQKDANTFGTYAKWLVLINSHELI